MRRCMPRFPLASNTLFWPNKLCHCILHRYITTYSTEISVKSPLSATQNWYGDKSSCSNMQSKFEIRIAQPEDKKELLKFLHNNYYYEEPLSISMEPKGPDPNDEEFVMNNLQYGCSLVAVQTEKENSEKVNTTVGTLISGPKYPDDLSKLLKEAEKFGNSKWGHIMKIIACIEHDANVFERYQVSKVMHAHALAVHSEVRGKSLGITLLKELIKLSKSLDYEVITIDCTSYYSAKLCDRLAWDCINILQYSDYLDDNNQQVFRPEAPHCCIKTYALRL